MATYVALLRGIMPMNPNMQSAKLKKAFEDMGFADVRTVISSGNVVFESNSKNTKAMEAKAEKYFPKNLGFNSTTIIRSQADLEKLVKKKPFKGIEDKKPNYLVTTFFKDGTPELCKVLTVTNLMSGESSKYMAALEKKHGKTITTRTWKTVGRILKKMDSPLAF